MTIEQLTQWMLQPQILGKNQIPELKGLCEEFPYFSISKMLLLKALQNTNDVLFETEMRKTTVYCHDRRTLFFLLYPTDGTGKSTIPNALQDTLPEEMLPMHQPEEFATGKGQSLKSLAQKLKEARLQGNPAEEPKIPITPVPEPIIFEEDKEITTAPETQESGIAASTSAESVKPQDTEIIEANSFEKKTTEGTVKNTYKQENESDTTLIGTEEEVIRLIKMKDYLKALKILRILYLNIPEKSVYFADQIRYLERIIATFNKS